MNKTHTNKSKFSEVTVSRIGIQGDGVANGAGEQYYVPYSAPGDRLLVAPKKSRKEGQNAKIEQIITEGPDRIEPVCRHFGTCGGCALQHVADRAVASAKREFIVNALESRGFRDVDIKETVTIAAGGRRRVRFSFHKGRVAIVGYRARRSHHVIDVQECPAIRPAIMALVAPLRDLTNTVTAMGRAASLLVTETDSGIDLLIRPDQEADLSLPDREALAAFADQYDLARIGWEGRSGPEPVAQRRPPRMTFGTAKIALPLGAFLQPSAAGEACIVNAAGNALAGATRIADLFAGCGALTFPLSSIAPTHAVENDRDMVTAVRSGTATHSVTATERDLAQMPLMPRELESFDGVVFDPPRAGAKQQAEQLAVSNVATILAISCNPATLARDLRILADGGYAIESILPIDQFPWSSHVEAVAILRRPAA